MYNRVVFVTYNLQRTHKTLAITEKVEDVVFTQLKNRALSANKSNQ